MQEKGPDDQHLFNTHVVVNALGDVIACYRKIHLFTFEDPDNDVHLDEGSFTKAGDQVVCCESDVGRLGLTVCYDLRFPHLYQMLRFDQHADILLVCALLASVLSLDAVFRCHLLLRCQQAKHTGRCCSEPEPSKPRAMSLPLHKQTVTITSVRAMVTPWRSIHGVRHTLSPQSSHFHLGEVLFDLGTEEDEIGVLEIDLKELKRRRASMPLHQHRAPFLQTLSEERERTVRPIS